MHIKFCKVGGGRRAGLAEYLTQERDHNGTVRESITILEGDPALVTKIADGLTTKHTLSHAVIAWHKNDSPTDEQMQSVISDFKKMAFSGQDENRFAFSLVEHGDPDGSKHIHFIMARTDLETGLSYNPAPPGWKNTFDPVRDLHNEMHGWANPTIERPFRLEEWKHNPDTEAAKIRQAVGELIMSGVESGAINNRADIVAALSEHCEIVRQGKNYITIKNPDDNSRVRLKGGLYNEQFNSNQFQRTLAAGAERTERAGTARAYRADPERIAGLQKNLNERLGNIQSQFHKRYDKKAEVHTRPHNQIVQRNSSDNRRDVSTGIKSTQKTLAMDDSTSLSDIRANLVRDSSIAQLLHNDNHGHKERPGISTQHTAADERQDRRLADSHTIQRTDIANHTRRQTNDAVQRTEVHNHKGEINNDTHRKGIDKFIEGINQITHGANQTIGRAARRAGEAINGTARRAGATVSRAINHTRAGFTKIGKQIIGSDFSCEQASESLGRTETTASQFHKSSEQVINKLERLNGQVEAALKQQRQEMRQTQSYGMSR